MPSNNPSYAMIYGLQHEPNESHPKITVIVRPTLKMSSLDWNSNIDSSMSGCADECSELFVLLNGLRNQQVY